MSDLSGSGYTVAPLAPNAMLAATGSVRSQRLQHRRRSTMRESASVWVVQADRFITYGRMIRAGGIVGLAAGYACPQCGYCANFVVDDFSVGFSGDVMVAVVCAEHGVVSTNTGINVLDGDMPARSTQQFACPECDVICPLWDRKTCPTCASDRIEQTSYINWD